MRTKGLIGPDRSSTAEPEPETMKTDRILLDQRFAFYEAIFANSIDGIAIIDTEANYLLQNRAHQTLLGYTDEELLGKTPAIHFGDEAFVRIAKELAATGTFRGE